MTVDQVIDAARKWRMHLDSQTIAEQIGLPEHVVYANLWRIRRVAAAERGAS